MAWQIGIDDDLDVVSQDFWDGQIAEEEIAEWAGIGTDNPNFNRIRESFLFYDDNLEDIEVQYHNHSPCG